MCVCVRACVSFVHRIHAGHTNNVSLHINIFCVYKGLIKPDFAMSITVYFVILIIWCNAAPSRGLC